MILWWSPDPRMVLFPNKIRISKSMQQLIKSNRFRITWNTRFEEVVGACSAIKRKGQEGTWITPKMKAAYLKLHQMGMAKSIEVWENEQLVGGLYGIDLGHIFCGESMFSKTSNASKFGFIHLALELQQKKYKLIDCQVHTDHLASLGAEEIPRNQFIKILRG